MELRVHDLVRLASPEAHLPDGAPEWVAASLRSTPWAVVRRAAPVDGLVAIGVRGTTRAERYGAVVPTSSVLEKLSPEDLVRRAPPRVHPSFAALARLAPLLDAEAFDWGPAGAAGYELATGAPALTEASDLDLVVRLETLTSTPALRRVSDAARALSGSAESSQPSCPAQPGIHDFGVELDDLKKSWIPALPRGHDGQVQMTRNRPERLNVQIDILVETPRGGVALGELLGDSDEVMLRTFAGPRLIRRDALAAGTTSC